MGVASARAVTAGGLAEISITFGAANIGGGQSDSRSRGTYALAATQGTSLEKHPRSTEEASDWAEEVNNGWTRPSPRLSSK